MNETNKEKLFDLDLLSIPDVSDSLFLDKQNAHIEGKKYIVFMLKETYFAIVSNSVSEVVRPLPYTSLPNFPNWFLGIANLRGDIISIVDLQMFWNLKQSDSRKSKLIVLRSDNSDSFIAFKVDKLREIVTISDKDIQECEENEIPHLTGKVTYNSHDIHIIDIEDILSSISLLPQI